MRQINWLAVLPQSALMFGLMIGLEYGLQLQGGALLGAMLYFAAFYLLQMLVPHHHRRGLLCIRRKEFDRALQNFRDSYEFFKARLWLDKYRAFILLSASSMSYREMALLNQAYCHIQLEQYDQARAVYERTLQEFPDSQMAKRNLSYFDKDET